MYLLDTDHITFLQLRHGTEYSRIRARINQVRRGSVYVSVVSIHEQSVGAIAAVNRARDNTELLRAYRYFPQLLRFYVRYPVLDFDQAAADQFDALRAQGVRRISTMDLRIAAIALTRGYTVLTANARDFSQVPGLSIEDWTV
jgi:tRNA(fMet)-specific endonuclease VapC